MLYSHNGSYPTTLPNRIRLSDGSTRTDPDTFTAEEIADAGYVAAGDPPDYNNNTQILGWDSDWTITNFDSAELNAIETQNWVGIREERNDLLEISDVYALKDLEAEGTVSDEIKNYRQSLRNIPQTYTTSSDVVWPDVPWVDSGDN